MSDCEDDDEEEVNSEAREKGESPCSTLLMMSLRLCQIMPPLQNADGAGQRQATASGKQRFCPLQQQVPLVILLQGSLSAY